MIRRNGIDALVPDRRHGFHTGHGLQGKGIFRPGLGFVRKGRERQRQVQGRTDPVELPVKFDGLAIFEIEDMDPDGLRPFFFVFPFQGLDGARLPAFSSQIQLFGIQHFPCTPEYGHDGPFGSIRRTHAYPDLLPFPDLGLPGQEEPPHRCIQRLVLRSDLQDPAALVIADLLVRYLRRHLQVIQSGGGQHQVHDGPGFYGSGGHGLARSILKGIGYRHRDLVPFGVAGGHFDPDRIGIHQIAGDAVSIPEGTARTENPFLPLVRRNELAVGRIQHVQGHLHLVGHPHAGFKVQGLPCRIHHLDRHGMVAGLLRGEQHGETAVGRRLHRLLGDDFPIAQDLRRHGRTGQRMAGIGLDLAADQRFLAGKEQPVGGVKVQGEGRQDEFVDPERPRTDLVLSMENMQGEIAVPLALGKGK